MDISGLSLEEEHFVLAQAVAAWLDTLKTDSPVVNRFCHVTDSYYHHFFHFFILHIDKYTEHTQNTNN